MRVRHSVAAAAIALFGVVTVPHAVRHTAGAGTIQPGPLTTSHVAGAGTIQPGPLSASQIAGAGTIQPGPLSAVLA